MSLRLRLTALTTVVLLMACVALGAVFLLTASRVQYGSIDRNLRTTVATERINGLITNPRPVPADVYSTVAIVRVDRSGATRVLRTAGYGSSPLPLPSLDAASIDSARGGPVTLHGHTDFRALANTPNGRGDSIVALTPLTEVSDQLAQLLRALVLAVILVTVAGAALAWLLLGRGLRPVSAMADAARSIASGDLDRRVPEAPPGTELGQLSESLNTMITELTSRLAEVRESEARLRAFVSDASHELRTPLTVIGGYSELLTRSPQERDALEIRALDRIGEEVHRMEDLLSQLLTLQRAEDRASTAEVEHVDAAAVFDRVFTEFAELHPRHEVLLQLQPVMVRGTNDEWTAVAGNLVQNIDRYTPVDSRVEVRMDVANDSCTITVDDNGPGVPPADRDRMLDRFARLDDSRSMDTGGTGLGLSIVRAIVERNDGTVELLASPIGGLRVRIDLLREPSAT